jgi:hypothetical protein
MTYVILVLLLLHVILNEYPPGSGAEGDGGGTRRSVENLLGARV